MKNLNHHQPERKAKRHRQEAHSLSVSASNSIYDAPETKAITTACGELPFKITEDEVIRRAVDFATQNSTSFEVQPPLSQENGYAAVCLAAIHLVERKIALLTTRLQKEIQQWNYKLKSIDVEKANPTFIFEEELKDDRENAHIKIKARHDRELIEVEDKTSIVQKSIKTWNGKIAFITTKSGIPTKRSIDKGWVYGLILLLLSTLEAPLNYTALQMLGIFNNLNAMVISIGLGFAAILLAHTAGASLQKKNWLSFTISFAASALLFSVIVYLRIDELIIALLPIVLWLVGLVSSYERSINSVFFTLQKAIASNQKKLTKLNQRRKTIENKVALEIGNSEKAFKEKANLLGRGEQDKNKIQEKINGLKSQLAEADAIEKEHIQSVTDFFVEKVTLFRNTINVQLQKQGHQPVIWNKPPSLEPSKNLEHKIPSPPPPGPNPFSKLNGVKNFASILLFALSSLFGMGGCTSDDATQTDGIVTIDKTEKNSLAHIQAPDYIADFVAGYFYEFDDSVTPDFGNITIGTIEESALSKTKTVSLERGEHYLLRTEKEREAQIMDFKHQLEISIDSVLQDRREHKNTQLYRHLCECTRRLKRSKADRKFLLVFSDLIEYTSSKSNFYQYKKHPERLLKDYDQIIKTMQSDCTVDLADVEIVIVQLPNEHDELGMTSRKFWEKFLQSQNPAEVTFLANL